MRYIDTSAFAPDPAWQVKADALTEQLLEATDEERKKIIEKNEYFSTFLPFVNAKETF